MMIGKRKLDAKRTTTRGAATRARIIEAAAELVFERGVGGTSLDDVMEASATSKSQLYHYFLDKDALMRAVIHFQTSRVLGFQHSLLSTVESLSGLQQWRDAAVAMSKATGGIGGCPIGSLASELADRSESARELLAVGFRMWETHLTDGLRTIQARGEIDQNTNIDDIATAVICALQGGILLSQVTRMSRPLELALDMALAHVARYSVVASK